MMKCDELKAFNMPRYAGEFTMHEVYLKSDVDSAIDELKTENESLLQQNRELCLALQVMYSKEEYDKQKAEHHKERHEYIKMIAELEEKLKNSRNAHKYWRTEYLIEYKECRHHKYKRCLAMAKECVN